MLRVSSVVAPCCCLRLICYLLLYLWVASDLWVTFDRYILPSRYELPSMCPVHDSVCLETSCSFLMLESKDWSLQKMVLREIVGKRDYCCLYDCCLSKFMNSESDLWCTVDGTLYWYASWWKDGSNLEKWFLIEYRFWILFLNLNDFHFMWGFILLHI